MKNDTAKRLAALEATRPQVARHKDGSPLRSATDADRMEESDVVDWAISIYRERWATWRGIDIPATIAISPDTHHIQDSEFASFYRRITERMNDIVKADGKVFSIILLSEIIQALEWLDSGDMRVQLYDIEHMRPGSKPWHRVTVWYKDHHLHPQQQHICHMYTTQFHICCDGIEAFNPDVVPTLEMNEAGFRQILEWMREAHAGHEASQCESDSN